MDYPNFYSITSSVVVPAASSGKIRISSSVVLALLSLFSSSSVKTTKKIEESLKRTENGISEEIKGIAEKAINDVKHQILAVLTEDEENKESNASTTDEEILIFLEDTAGTTTEEVLE